MVKSWPDAGFTNAVIEHGRSLGIDVEVVSRDPQTKEFAPAPNRWIAEQTFGTLMLHRRLARDYETLPASSASWMRWSTDIMTHRLTATTTPTWRDPPPARCGDPA
uniref:transposase n=1 Tax=Streptomyces polyasparticus TaxID=2767826 RepID=UPI001BE4412C|nr:transposase [Streptomyces polyasparticus]